MFLQLAAWAWLVFVAVFVCRVALMLYREAREGNPVAAGLLLSGGLVVFVVLTLAAARVVLG